MSSRSVAKQLAAKLKLEKKLKPKLTKLFKQIGKDVNTVWSATRQIPNLNSFDVELVTILRQHYRDVAKAFTKIARDSLKSSITFNSTKQIEEIPGGSDSSESFLAATAITLLSAMEKAESEIIKFINEHSIRQSKFILETTENNLRETVKRVITQTALEGRILTQREIGDLIEKEFNATSKGRIDTIAMTETQTPSETIKLLEATALAVAVSGGREDELKEGTVVKTWNAILDAVTRPAHRAAHGQTVPNNTPFIVGGERLPAPGNSFLGASLGNVINCRCIATFDVIGGGDFPVDITLQ